MAVAPHWVSVHDLLHHVQLQSHSHTTAVPSVKNHHDVLVVTSQASLPVLRALPAALQPSWELRAAVVQPGGHREPRGAAPAPQSCSPGVLSPAPGCLGLSPGDGTLG